MRNKSSTVLTLSCKLHCARNSSSRGDLILQPQTPSSILPPAAPQQASAEARKLSVRALPALHQADVVPLLLIILISDNDDGSRTCCHGQHPSRAHTPSRQPCARSEPIYPCSSAKDLHLRRNPGRLLVYSCRRVRDEYLVPRPLHSRHRSRRPCAWPSDIWLVRPMRPKTVRTES